MGYYGQQNAGDDMMLYCILDWLKNQKLKLQSFQRNVKILPVPIEFQQYKMFLFLDNGAGEKLVNGSVIRLVAAFSKL